MDPLKYHQFPVPGKIEIYPTKKCTTQDDLSFAYTPGVAQPCLKIKEDSKNSMLYTNRSNLVGVITNGSAVLGLGNIGALASKPVMEGKAVLFKRFADVDVFDLEINADDPDVFIETVARLAPTFGGINLEDIKAPECFYIEDTLSKQMGIPVFHDDQHGTAIITGAALLNALEIVSKKIDAIKVVVNGAGAAGIACARFYLDLGVKKENLILCDTKGVIYNGRQEGMNAYKRELAADSSDRTLAEAMNGADVFLGLSVKGALSEDMLKNMSNDPIIFALANPDPEILPEQALAVRNDVIMATGRSDYPNQVNNVLGFPFIFRGALDVGARHVNDKMKIAAAKSLSAITKEDVTQDILDIYKISELSYGKDYLIPKPFDKRVFTEVSAAVAGAAVDSGIAGIKSFDLLAYKNDLEERYNKKIARFA